MSTGERENNGANKDKFSYYTIHLRLTEHKVACRIKKTNKKLQIMILRKIRT